MLRRRADLLAFIFCLVFVALGSAWISEMGIQTDEALFVGGIYPPYAPGVELFGKTRPLMLMPYVGAAKSYIWKPFVRNLGPSPAVTRLPAVALGGLTIWLFYLLIKRTLGLRAALTGAALLAADATYVITTRWDWGPVALQHLFAVGGALCIVRFHQEKRLLWLAIGCFAFGLGCWDKALFFWTLSGLGIATLVVFPRHFFRALSMRTVGIAAGALLLGASPVIAYNIRNPWITFKQSSWSLQEPITQKALVLVTTLTGGGMLGSVVRDDWEGPKREPDDFLKRAWVRLTEWSGTRRSSLYAYLAGFAILLAPLTWRTPAWSAFLFVSVYCAVAWLQMAFTVGAAGSPHHTVLMWPFPHLAIAGALAEASRKAGRVGVPALASVMLAACLSSVAVIGTYYSNMLRYGGVKEWTDAIYPAAEALPAMKPAFVCFLDWGFYDNVRLLTRGRLDVCAAVDPAKDEAMARRQMANPGVLYMTHTSGNRVWPELTENFLALAVSEGYRKTNEHVFYDYNGRPIIEVFKLFRP